MKVLNFFIIFLLASSGHAMKLKKEEVSKFEILTFQKIVIKREKSHFYHNFLSLEQMMIKEVLRFELKFIKKFHKKQTESKNQTS